MTPVEVTQWVEDTRRKSFKNGWDAAVDRAEKWLNLRMASKNTIEQFRQFMEE